MRRDLGRAAVPTLVALAGLWLLVPTRAYAYVHPGYGTLIWQALLSAGIGALFVRRRAVAILLSKLGIRRPPHAVHASAPGTSKWKPAALCIGRQG